MTTYKALSQKHPEWDGPYWRRCRALYAGGKKLLADKDVMAAIFPAHLSEKSTVYEERKARAYIIPYAGEIIDMITSALFSSDIAMTAEPKAEPWYDDWAKNVSPPGGQKQTLQRFLKDQITTALLCKKAWTLVDLPEADTAVQAAADTGKAITAPAGSELEQDQLGLLNAYACPLDPENVWDWEVDKDGQMLWAMVHYRTNRRLDINAARDSVTEQWMYYTRTSWQRYEITYPLKTPPNPNDEVILVKEGGHSFGRVPIIPLELTDGLWAMGKIEPIAVAHFNKRNALSWAQYKSLFPVMAHFAGPPDVTNPISEDPNRAVNQIIGQGHILQLADKDRFEFVSPPTDAYRTAAEDLNTLRDEMHRVVHQMALSVDNSAAALQRSAASKQVDQSATFVILREFGKIVREHAIELHEVVQIGRADKTLSVWGADGMDSYADASVDALVLQAQTLELISIPSATFQREFKFLVARRVLGDSVEEDVLEDIWNDLEENVNNEQFQAPAMMAMGALDAEAEEDEGVPGEKPVKSKDELLEEKVEASKPKPKKPAVKPKGKAGKK